MSANTRNIVDLCVAGNLVAPGGTRLILGSLDQGSPNPLPTHLMLDVPTLDERHR